MAEEQMSESESTNFQFQASQLLSPSTKRSRSTVWDHYGFENSDTDFQSPICKYCETKVIVPAKDSNTSGLWRHMKRTHPEVELKSKEDVKQSETTGKLKQSTLLQHTSKPFTSSLKQTLDEKLAIFISKDLQPFAIVEDVGFRQFVSELQPRYQLPTRTHLCETVYKKLYDETKQMVQLSLTNAKFVSLTTDAWTSHATESYIAVTAHFLDAPWQMKSFVLETNSMPENHTAQNLAQHLVDTLKVWKLLENKDVIYVTTDNASNVVIACEIAGVKHMRCFAHSLNLSEEKGINDRAIASILSHIRHAVKYFHRLTIAVASFTEAQTNVGLAKQKLMLDCPTRWNSTYDMLLRFKNQHRAVAVALYCTKLSPTDLSAMRGHIDAVPEDVLDDVCHTLKPFCDATSLISGEKYMYVTISLVHPLKCMLLTKLVVNDADSKMVKTLKEVIEFDLKGRYTNPSMEKFLLVATTLDPRFKSLKHVPSSDHSDIYENTVLAVLKLWEADCDDILQSADSSESNVPSSSSGTSASNSSVEVTPPQSVLDNLFGNTFDVDKSDNVDTLDRIHQEVDGYRKSESLNINEDPLSWWAQNSAKYPKLSKAAKYYLTIQCTSVLSERIFLAAGEVVSSKRARLTSSNVNMQIFLNKSLD